MARSVTAIAVFAALGYAGLCLTLFVFQRSLIYQPRPFPKETLARALPLAADGGDILITVLERKGGRALIYFGGNAEVVPLSLPELVRDFPGRSLYLPHYRGYGGSAGSPSETALFADALAVYDMVRQTHDDIAVMGRSLGSGVATYLAAHRPVSRLVLVTPFDSLATVAAGHYPFFPVRLLLRDRFDSAFWAGRVDAPTLILAAEKDSIVPLRSARRLHDAFRSGLASFHVLRGEGHNTVSSSPAYSELLRGAR